MTNSFDKLSDKPLFPVYLQEDQKPLEINGGRTRARTWDPLIKSQVASAVFAWLFFKPSRFSAIGNQWLAAEIQTAIPHPDLSAPWLSPDRS